MIIFLKKKNKIFWAPAYILGKCFIVRKEETEMEINSFVTLVTNVGFPVAVSTYLLIRLEKQILGLTASINKLNSIISAKLGIVIDSAPEEKDKTA